MIYSFTILNDDNVTKQFYLSADNQSQLIRRASTQYCVPHDRITILGEYDDATEDIKLKQSFVKKIVKSDKKQDEIMKKAQDIFANQKRRSVSDLDDYVYRHKLTKASIENVSDLYSYVQKYKFIKVYATPGEKRGTKLLYAVYK